MVNDNYEYRVIARRWRPKTFDELVGQGYIVRTLKNAINTGKIAHAYLFVGPRGTGKTTTARLFATALNAENGPSATFDANGETASEIAQGCCLDVIEIDGASNNSVDQIRSLREECQYAPVKCRYKIYIIDEVHMLSNAAFNALLKTLEEPPAHVKFIFATTEANKVLPTITSRCQRFSFRPVDGAVLHGKLREIADLDGIEISDDALKLIVRLANGGVRDAQSTLDQMAAFCANKIEESDILSAYGLISDAKLDAIIGAMRSGNYEKILSLCKEIVDSNCDLYRVLCDLESRLHSQLSHLLSTNNEIFPEREVRILEALHYAKDGVKSGFDERTNFESALLHATEQSQSRAIDSILQILRKQSAQFVDAKENTPTSSRLPKSTQNLLQENFHAKIRVLKSE
ncbi:MAG: DNA polymerase III subunit gamma/tau [Puniceicoccales bacterium]|jgi:DNA polymerase-3 subunit gamma/tau|nr:DNA polymerase III subunit gamma/tau [Puniceicoccales bacterium]